MLIGILLSSDVALFFPQLTFTCLQPLTEVFHFPTSEPAEEHPPGPMELSFSWATSLEMVSPQLISSFNIRPHRQHAVFSFSDSSVFVHSLMASGSLPGTLHGLGPYPSASFMEFHLWYVRLICPFCIVLDYSLICDAF